jgi:hypothetical protein
MMSPDEPRRPANGWRSIRYVGGSYRIPRPPGPPDQPGRAQREQEARSRARGDIQVARLHLLGLFRVGVVVMGLVLVAVVVLAILALASHH